MTTNNKVFPGLIILILLLVIGGLLVFFKVTPAQKQAQTQTAINPYKDNSINVIYNLLFCDNLNLYKNVSKKPSEYPFNILFSETSSVADLQNVIDDKKIEPRIRLLAYNRQLAIGYKPIKKEVIAVIVEVGLDDGLDVLASFNNGTARYINQAGKLLVWETTNDNTANRITKSLFADSQNIVSQTGPWHKARRPCPTKGNARITFLVSDGLYFGEGPIDVLFNDPMAGPALAKATELMQYLTQESLNTNK